MNDELAYKMIDPEMPEFAQITELFNTAFPPEERPFSIEEAAAVIREQGGFEARAAFDGDALVGLYAVQLSKEYTYLHFLAVTQKIRGKGYGGRILRKLMEDNKDRILMAAIENPVPGKEGYEIKRKRQQFYEKNGMITVNRPRMAGGLEFITVTNKTGEVFEHCYVQGIAEEMKQFELAEKLHRQQ